MRVQSHFLGQIQRFIKRCKSRNTGDEGVLAKNKLLGIRGKSDNLSASLAFNKAEQIKSSLPSYTVKALSQTLLVRCLSKCYMIWSTSCLTTNDLPTHENYLSNYFPCTEKLWCCYSADSSLSLSRLLHAVYPSLTCNRYDGDFVLSFSYVRHTQDTERVSRRQIFCRQN